MTAIDDLFAKLRGEGRKAFMPFITAGDPDMAFTCQVIELLHRLGCSMAEVGIPYSDPIADGPVIQASYTRALGKKLKLQQIFDGISGVAPKVSMPLVSMVSYAIIHRIGPEKYIDAAKGAGFAGAIVPDLLVEESDALSRICRQKDFNLIQLVTPTTPRERALKIAEQSTAFCTSSASPALQESERNCPPILLIALHGYESERHSPFASALVSPNRSM